MTRPTWDEYYLGIAQAVAARGDCVRRQVGAVIVKDHKIVSTGYNGTPPGDERSCGKTGLCPRALTVDSQHGLGHYDECWSTHAEANALLRASWAELNGATLYVTAPMCSGCAKLARSAGVACIISADLL